MIRKAKVGQLGDGKVGNKFPKCDKLIVVLAVAVATGLCTTHLCEIVGRFFRAPVANCVRIDKSNTFKVPAFVVCPTFADVEVNETETNNDTEINNNSEIIDVLEDDLDEDSDQTMFNVVPKLADKIQATNYGDDGAKMSSFYNTPFDQLNVSLDDLWSHSRINVKLSCNACRVAVDRVKCKGNGASVIRFESSKPTIFGGECVIVTQVDELYYSQRSKGLKFKIRTDTQRSISRIAMAFVDNLQSVAYDMSFESTIVRSNSQIVIFNLRKFKYLNRKSSPCLMNDEARKCVERAIEDDLENLKLCNLPMLDQSRHPKNCSTLAETESDVKKLADWFLQENVRKCPRKCHDGVVSFREVIANPTNSKSNNSFTIHLANNVQEEIWEEYAYSASALLNDIAGDVGFYLGISLINIISKPLLVLRNRFI